MVRAEIDMILIALLLILLLIVVFGAFAITILLRLFGEVNNDNNNTN